MMKMHPLKFWLLYPYWWYYDYKKEYTLEEIDERYGFSKIDPNSQKANSKYFYEAWEKLKSMKQEGDKLYFYRSRIKNWSKLAGKESIFLERNGEIIFSLVMARN